MKPNGITTAEIVEALEAARHLPNYCDTMLALKDYEKIYKGSEFYKKTRMPLKQLYFQYSINATLTLRSLLNNLNELLAGIDADNFIAMMDEVNAKTAAAIEKEKLDIANNDFLNILMGLANNNNNNNKS